MAEFFKIEKDGKAGVLEAKEVFPDLQARVNRGTGVASVYDAKAGEWVAVGAGKYIISIADRYEVADKEPAKAKPVEVDEPEDEPKKAAPKKAPEPKAEPKVEAEVEFDEDK